MILEEDHEEGLLGNAGREHIARLYAEDPELVRDVAEYLRGGVRRREALMVVATPEHWDAIAVELERSGVDVAGLRAAGQLVVFNAVETLPRIMGDKGPDAVQLQRIVGGAMQNLLKVSQSGRARVFGEMVDLLWQANDQASALQLERYWEGLLLSYPFSVLCSYQTGLLDPATDPRGVEGICMHHTHVLPKEERTALDAAVADGFGDVLGEERAKALQPLVDAMIYPSRSFGRAERTVFWTRRNLPTLTEPLLESSRGHLERTRQVK